MEIATAVSTVAALVEPDASPERVGILSRFIADQDYSAAEMKLIAKEGPKANHYGKHVRVDVLHAIVEESRRLRAMLARAVTADELATLCTAHPEIDPNDFAQGPFDARNAPTYRYAPEIAARARERGIQATPVLDEPTPERRSGAGSGLTFAQMVAEEMAKNPAQA